MKLPRSVSTGVLFQAVLQARSAPVIADLRAYMETGVPISRAAMYPGDVEAVSIVLGGIRRTNGVRPAGPEGAGYS